MNDEQIKQLIASNAKAISSLTTSISEEKKERQKMYKAIAKMSQAIANLSERLSQIGVAQASLWELEADYYRRMDEIDQRHKN